MIKNCKNCGPTEFKLTSQGYFTCKKCHSNTVIKARRNMKTKAVIYLGGKCSECGYNKCMGALEFHHSDPNEKEFNIFKNGVPKSWEKIVKELNKCILLCANCHRELHWLINK